MKIRIPEHARDRVLDIATEIVASRISAGEIDPEDAVVLRAATGEAVQLAWDVYRAAEEFLHG